MLQNILKDWKKWAVLALRITFGVLVIVASMDKVLKPIDFSQMVTNYRIPFFLTPEVSRWIGIWLPYVEIMVGAFLIFGIWLDAAVIINSILMAIFTTLVTQAYFRGLDISCGCFAVDEAAPSIGIGKVIENLVLTGGSILLAWMTFKFDLVDSLKVRFPKRCVFQRK